jgi:hypothetical protein
MVILSGVKTLLVAFILYHTTSKNSGSFDAELVISEIKIHWRNNNFLSVSYTAICSGK